MKSSKPGKTKRSPAAAVAVAPTPQPQYWKYAAGLFVAFLVLFEIYSPAINGPFLLDDSYLPYMLPGYASAPLMNWVRGMRPLLMFSYWLNFQSAGSQSTFGYHLVNVLLHFSNGVLIGLAAQKVLNWVGIEKWRGYVLALFAAGLFLAHPLQTESVSYIASRSETLSVFWVLAAVVVFLYRVGDSVSWTRTVAILALFGAAVLTKEHAAALPAVFLLTDYFWNPGFSLVGIRRNWRLYVPTLIASAVGFAFVWRVLSGASGSTAGFGVKDFTWYQYFFTQCRVIWDYLLMFMLPVGQNVDADVPISRTISEHGAIFGLVALVAVSVAAWIYRRKIPLACYGWFTFLILIAPTSSFVPILDPLAERRLYLPFIGLLFVVLELLRRWKTTRATMVIVLGIVLVLEAAATYQRNQLWSNAVDLWKDSVSKSPTKLRPRFQLAFAYYLGGRCEDAVTEFGKAAQFEPPKFDLLVDWALAYDCAGKGDEAIAKLKQAATLERSAHVYSQIGMEYGKMGKNADALEALETASNLDPNFAMTYYYRGAVYLQQGNRAQAANEFRHVLQLDPTNQLARDALAKTGQ